MTCCGRRCTDSLSSSHSIPPPRASGTVHCVSDPKHVYTQGRHQTAVMLLPAKQHGPQWHCNRRLTIRLSNHKAAFLEMAQPVEAWVGQPVLQVMRVRRHTHHVQHPLPQRLCLSSVASCLRRALCTAVGLLKRYQERALPHGSQIMIPQGLGLAINEGAHVLPACNQTMFAVKSDSSSYHHIST